ncbi:hypothetical protein [Brachybacterium kimchii]|uniref:Phage tail protein n=1 Tax=Brachybacterium kimchii TaxID=2942909 RepID=A0ABY4N6M4_9MICO|nr:hypothetical protein [Brachybacterium kimchii]UQN29486.1 hypothetical protein M4486_17905 [Brachybacterium kimchii]
MKATIGGMPLNGGAWKVLGTEGLLDSPGFQVPSVERLRHGALGGKGRAQGRTVKVTGRVETTSAAEQMQARNTLAGLFRDGGSSTAVIENGGFELSSEVQLIDQVTFRPMSVFYASWELSLYSVDPFLYGPDRVSYSFPGGIGVGLAFPLFGAPGVLTYGTAVDADQPVTNQGTQMSYPTMYIVGDFPGGVQITAAGRTILWPWPTDARQPVRIEQTGTVWVGASNLTNQARTRQWMPLEPGDTYTPRLSALQGGTGYLETHQRDPYV